MREHPDRETLQQFISGQLGSEDARLTDRHLAVCSECRDRADEISAYLTLQLLDSWLRPGYEEAFERASNGAVERLAVIFEEARDTESLFGELLRDAPSERRRKIINEERFQTLKLCEFFRSRSRGCWSSDLTTALELADSAVEIALHLDQGRYGSSLVEDARALAWGYLGNTYRITSDLWRAEKALRQGWLHHLRGGADALTETELLHLTSSLRHTQGRFDDAAELIDRAIEIYQEGQDLHLEGAALIQKGSILGNNGRAGESVQLILEGMKRIDPAEEPSLLLAGKHNLICSLTYAGAPIKARKLLDESRSLHLNLGCTINLARFRWLEGQIAREFGQLAQATGTLHQVREFFLEQQMGIDVSLVTLDLAGVYMNRGMYRPAYDLLDEVIPLAEALGLRDEALLARFMLEKVWQA